MILTVLAKVTHEDFHAAKKAHDHNLFHGHDPTHGKHHRVLSLYWIRPVYVICISTIWLIKSMWWYPCPANTNSLRWRRIDDAGVDNFSGKGGHTRPHGPHHSKFDKHGHAIGRREAEHTEEAEEKWAGPNNIGSDTTRQLVTYFSRQQSVKYVIMWKWCC